MKSTDDVEARILRAIRELTYGSVEVVVHEGRVTEVRQTRRTRITNLRTMMFAQPTGHPEE